MKLSIALLALAAAAPSLRAETPTARPALAVTTTFPVAGPAGGITSCSTTPTTCSTSRARRTRKSSTPPPPAVKADIQAGEGLHGVAVAPKFGRGYISDGKAAKIIAFDLKTNKVLAKIDAADDADGIIFDPGTNLILTACGDAHSLVLLDASADPTTAKTQAVDLGGKPEFLAADGKGMAYVCMEEQDQIAAVDLKSMKVVHRWATGTGKSPAGLAIDPTSGTLFAGCHNQKLVVMNAADGTVIDELPIGGGNDAVAFDPATGEAFASCGDGTLTVAAPAAAGHYAVSQTVQTQQGARTVALDPSTRHLYLPTAEYGPRQPGKRWPPVVPGTFRIVEVAAAK